MPFFGQVWVWSLAAFLVGALLCWALVARPARRRVIELEDSLAAARRNRQEPAYQPEHRDRAFDDYDGYPAAQEDTPAELIAPPEAGHEPNEPPPLAPVESTQLLAAPPVAEHPPVEAPAEVEPEWYPVAERFDVSRLDAAESPEDEHLVDDLPDEQDPADDEPAGTIFTQHTTPISGSLIRRIDDAGDTSLVDDLDDDLHDDDLHDDADSTADDAIDPHRGHFADALTPDDEEEQLVAAEPATRYLPPVPAEPEPEHAEPKHAEPEHAEDEAPAEPEPPALPKRVVADEGLPKRTPGGESRMVPFGEATAYSPSPNMFAPAQTDRPRHGLPPGPAAEPTVYAAAVQPETAARHDAEARPEPEPTVFAPSVPEPVEEVAAPLLGSLPKRVPKKPGDRFPFGVRTGTPEPEAASSSAPQHSATAEAEPERARSLFEPIMAADEPGATKALPVAPSRPKRGSSSRPSQVLPGGVDTFVPPGPFGPGSAMPLPGGNSPSSEYRVKASVTALRYCSPESPRFDRTVAEVWFRSVADAERVGFRPLA